jgi:hypothetical protein
MTIHEALAHAKRMATCDPKNLDIEALALLADAYEDAMQRLLEVAFREGYWSCYNEEGKDSAKQDSAKHAWARSAVRQEVLRVFAPCQE